jgi:hypothetical protein
MKRNVGNVDRIIRMLSGIVLATLYFTGIATGTAGYLVLAIGIIFLVTSTIRFCPLYAVFGASTCPIENSSPKS